MDNIYGKDVVGLLMKSIDKLAESHDKTNDKVDKLIEAMSKQDVILEKLANVETRHSDSINRVHKVIETKDAAMAKRVDIIEDRLASIATKDETTEKQAQKGEIAYKILVQLALWIGAPTATLLVGAVIYVIQLQGK